METTRRQSNWLQAVQITGKKFLKGFLKWWALSVILEFEMYDNMRSIQKGDGVKFNWRAKICLGSNLTQEIFTVKRSYDLVGYSRYVVFDDSSTHNGADAFWLKVVERKSKQKWKDQN